MATGTKGLMLWCKNITKNYGHEVEIKNMASSWKDGMAFCAILHHYRPDLIDFNKLSKENVAVNNEIAFRVAEDELGIPALLDVEDMVTMRVPDRLSIMTYVSQYYNYFRDKVPGEIVTHRIPSKKRPNTDTIEAIPAKIGGAPGRLAVRVGNQAAPSGVANACFTCGKTVYLMERLSIEGKLFHRICFKCCTCGTQLKTSTYEFDGKEHKFYCEKHFEDRGKIRDEPEGKEQTPEKQPLSNIHEDIAMNDPEPPTDITSSPFVRNDQFFRKGIRPQSSPADLQWEKTKVIKSKEEEHKTPEKTKSKSPSKKFFGSVLKKKPQSPSENVDFANPAYQQHLDLANFMNKLDSEDYENASDRIVIGSESNKANIKESSKTNTLSGVHISDAKVNKFSGDVENQNDQDTKISKGIHKKKLVLKIKKKKKKDKGDDEHDEDKTSNLKQNESITPVKFNRTSSTSSNYENIENFTNVENVNKKLTDPRYQDDKKIYDNTNLCTVFNDSTVSGEENHYAEPSSVDVPIKSDSNNDSVYHNISVEPSDDSEKSNPLLLAARNRLLSSGRGKKNNKAEQSKSCDNVSADSQYLDVRSHLRKVKSTENVLSDVDSNRNDADAQKTDAVGQVFLNARAHLNKTGRSVEVLAEKSDNYDDTDSLNTNQKAPDKSSDDLQIKNPIQSVEEPEPDSVHDNTSSLLEDKKTNETELKFSPFKIEKKSSVKLQKLTSPISNEKNIPILKGDEKKKEDNITDNVSDHMDVDNDNDEQIANISDADMKYDGQDESQDASSNPFLTPNPSPTPLKKTDNTNPFLSSNEDILFESDDEFDDSNPFADDARMERRDTLSKQASLKRGGDIQKSLDRKKDLQKIGIDESNPFADDLIDEMDDIDESNPFADDLIEERNSHEKLKKQTSIHVPEVTSHMPTGGKKLVLKNRHGRKLQNRPVSAPVVMGVVQPVAVPRPKKRSAPKPPEQKIEPIDSPPTSGKGTLKKRQAPHRPSVLPTTEKPSEEKPDKTSSENATLPNSVDSVKTTQDDDAASSELKTSQDSPKQSTPKRPPAPTRQMSEKRKAPARPPQPYLIDEDTIMRSVALRDKQPRRDEMEIELKFLETRQRELEMEGVVMEKKLRECSNDEPEEAYLLTWFELVNQKNLLLRRENELIYLCQELDFLQNQRRAEFELRQLMSKPDNLKTLSDRMREDALLADILNFVTKRSNIIDKMDEDRLREYEEDQDINNMMEAQGFSSPSHEKLVGKESKEKTKKKKEKDKKNNKEKVKKKKSVQ